MQPPSEARYAIVVTTINHPTPPVVELARGAPRLGARFYLIGDQKSPADFHQDGATYLDLRSQQQTGLEYAAVAPAKHYARKNIGYLCAIRDGANVLIETDDDNMPLDDFWHPRDCNLSARTLEHHGWSNVYGYFTDKKIWPRGLPLEVIADALADLPEAISPEVYCPIQQGLADGNPDVDAIYRLVLPLPFSFRREEPVALRGPWCPFNSQNTTWWPPAFPLLYLPYYCSFRMTDIWRSFVAQRIAYANGWAVGFHNATVFQDRNEHNLLRDFEEEVPGYLNNAKIRAALEAVDLRPGEEHIPAALVSCYEALVAQGFVGGGELALVKAWLRDLENLRSA